MKEIISKISSYDLFNNLFPGILFVVLLESTTNYNLPHDNIVESAFLYYFVGLMISRVGSLLVDPSLRKLKFVKFKPYPKYLAAEEKDELVKIYNLTNNMLRTLIALFLVLLIPISLTWMNLTIDFSMGYIKVVFVFILLLILLLSYRKQTKFIFKRVEYIENKKEA